MLFSLRSVRATLPALGAALLLAGPAAAITDPGTAPDCPANDPGIGAYFVCFDDQLSLTATSAQAYPFVDIIDATIFSEADAATAFGLDTTFWASTGDQGIVNNLVPVIELDFSTDVTLFRVDVLSLPGNNPVVVQGFRDGVLLETILSTAGDPLPETDAVRLLIKDVVGFDEIRLFVADGPCNGADCVADDEGLFFADSVKFILPEPGVVAMLGFALLGLAGMGRRRA